MAITLWSGAIANVSWVQYVVLAKNLFLAAKGPAEEAAREKKTCEGVGDECDIVPLCDTGRFACVSMTRATFQNRTSLSFNSMFSAKLMPWYTFLIVFRVLSISLVIVALPTIIWIPIYALLLLGIIFIGYWKTKRDWDFITRGLKSAFTSGLDQMDFNTY